MTWLPPGQAVPAAKLAAFYRLPAAYLNKQLQALARAGIVSTSGPRGGFQLARSPEKITLAHTSDLTGNAMRAATTDGLRTAVFGAAIGIVATALIALGFTPALRGSTATNTVEHVAA